MPSASMNGSLRKIGNYLGLRTEIDKNNRVTNLIRSNLSVVDILPVDYALNFSYLTKAQGQPGYAVVYDFETPANGYAKRCKHYALPEANGLQLWLTDDTQAYEEMSNQYENNLIETGLNALADKGRQLQSLVRTFGPNTDLSQTINASGQFVKGGVDKVLGALGVHEDNSIGNTVGNFVGTAVGMALQGRQISLPKIWKQSDYNPSITFNVKLVSPYGNPESIKHFIIEPLIYILLLASPESIDGLTYGLAQPVKIKSYGITNINLGAITSISLRRGGRESSYNVYKQPLQIDVGINCIPLSAGFAHMADNAVDVIDMDWATKPYSENANGSPAFTTVGNIIQSLRPAPNEVVYCPSNTVNSNYSASNASNQSFDGINNLKSSVANFKI